MRSFINKVWENNWSADQAKLSQLGLGLVSNTTHPYTEKIAWSVHPCVDTLKTEQMET